MHRGSPPDPLGGVKGGVEEGVGRVGSVLERRGEERWRRSVGGTDRAGEGWRWAGELWWGGRWAAAVAREGGGEGEGSREEEEGVGGGGGRGGGEGRGGP